MRWQVYTRAKRDLDNLPRSSRKPVARLEEIRTPRDRFSVLHAWRSKIEVAEQRLAVQINKLASRNLQYGSAPVPIMVDEISPAVHRTLSSARPEEHETVYKLN